MELADVEMEKKINKLLEEMTDEEKIAQLSGVYLPDLLNEDKSDISEEKVKILLGKGAGELSRVYGTLHKSTIKSERDRTLEDSVKIAVKIKKFLKEETRLGIPAIFHEECIAGLMTDKATAFPQSIGMASSWNPQLIESMATVIRRQMRDAGVHHGLSPVLDICCDPRWGRSEETYGEDPYLVAQMGVSFIKGLQGACMDSGIMATGKHFAGHGFSEGGRNQTSVHIGERELRDIFLLPFEAAVKKACLSSVMNAYHDIDGIPCASSVKLFKEILRGEWGFEGIVVSDYDAVVFLFTRHRVASDKAEAARLSLNAGIDVELPACDCYGKNLLDDLISGKVKRALIDESVSRILRKKFQLGLFDEKPEKILIKFDTPEDRKIAYQCAVESFVLLKNTDSLLPLARDTKQIALIGPSADEVNLYFGDYSYTSAYHLSEPAVECKSILQAMREKLGDRLLYARGCGIEDDSVSGLSEAVETARKADIILFAGGERSGAGLTDTETTGEHNDSHNIRLPGLQERLIKEICALGKPLILILINGRPLDLSLIEKGLDAILECWLPGEEGADAITDIIFGSVSPSGRLPVSFPAHVGQMPVYYRRKSNSMDKKYFALGTEPLFPFGFGLTYTQFEYSDLSVEPDVVDGAGTVNISFTLKNTGNNHGAEVVQLYVKDLVSSVVPENMLLKGFKKVSLAAGKKAVVEFSLPVEILSFHNREMELVVEEGAHEVLIGASSRNIRLKGKFRVAKGKRFEGRNEFFSSSCVKHLD